jgi:hypothetical protein
VCVCIYICIYKDSIIKPTKHFGKVGRKGGLGNIIEGVNLFKVYCASMNYHSENPLIVFMNANKENMAVVCSNRVF